MGDVILDDSSPDLALASGWLRGKIHTAGKLVDSPAGKADLLRRTGAVAVDMETAIVRQAAARAGVPFIGIRAISDTSVQTLDPIVLRFIDEVGNPRPGALAAGLLRHPGLLSYLSRLEAATALASRRLGEAVVQILDTSCVRTQWMLLC